MHAHYLQIYSRVASLVKWLVQQLWCYWQVPDGDLFVGNAAADRVHEHAPVLKKVATMFLSHSACCCGVASTSPFLM